MRCGSGPSSDTTRMPVFFPRSLTSSPRCRSSTTSLAAAAHHLERGARAGPRAPRRTPRRERRRALPANGCPGRASSTRTCARRARSGRLPPRAPRARSGSRAAPRSPRAASSRMRSPPQAQRLEPRERRAREPRLAWRRAKAAPTTGIHTGRATTSSASSSTTTSSTERDWMSAISVSDGGGSAMMAATPWSRVAPRDGSSTWTTAFDSNVGVFRKR